jgi:hypothetical protein
MGDCSSSKDDNGFMGGNRDHFRDCYTTAFSNIFRYLLVL